MASNNPLVEQLVRIRESLSCSTENPDCANCGIAPSECSVVKNFEHGVADLFEIMQQRFKREEEFMRLLDTRRGRDSLFESHMESHADMMHRISKLFVDRTPTASEIKTLRSLVDYWLHDHMAAHDAALESMSSRI